MNILTTIINTWYRLLLGRRVLAKWIDSKGTPRTTCEYTCKRAAWIDYLEDGGKQ